MRRLTLVLAAAVLAAGAPAHGQDRPDAAATLGVVHIDLLGDYVGKRIVFRVDGVVVEDRRFTFPPPGAVDRVEVASGPARVVRVQVEIDGCPTLWKGEVAVAPGKGSGLVFDGCSLRTFGPS